MFQGWAIDRDYFAEQEGEDANDNRTGYGQKIEDAELTAKSFPLRQVFLDTGLKASEVENSVRMRLLDDDGEVYYGGAISQEWLNDESLAFSPLAWAEADAGATELQVRDENNNWVTL